MVHDAARRATYRQLLRAASASVRFARPATRSLRKLLREDFEHAHAASFVPERTLALFLLSALYQRPVAQPERLGAPPWRPRSDTSAAHLAHRCTANLVSLTYHHLSPHTPMRSQRVGGTSRSTAPRKRSAISDALGPMGAQASKEESGAHLDVLTVPAKPVRGPVGIKPLYWDAQHPEKHLAAAQGHDEMETLQTQFKVLAERHAALAQEHGVDHPRTKEAKAKMVDLRGSLKGMRRSAANRASEAALAQYPKDALWDVVQRVAASEALCLGMPRWDRWRQGGYLAP